MLSDVMIPLLTVYTSDAIQNVHSGHAHWTCSLLSRSFTKEKGETLNFKLKIAE